MEILRNKTHVIIPEHHVLSKVLADRIKVFQGKRSNWKGKMLNLELHPGPEPVVARPVDP